MKKNDYKLENEPQAEIVQKNDLEATNESAPSDDTEPHVPNIDALSVEPTTTSGLAAEERLNKAELRILEAEAGLKEYQNKEASQRYWLRWIAPTLGGLVIIGMAGLQMHLLHRVFLGPIPLVSSSFLVAALVVPAISITSITIALFVGAFRKFQDGDVESAANSTVAAARVLK